jgi:glutamate synthase (NADPH/NADH) small chain
MPNRKPQERIKDFESVALGFSEEQALIEAARCIQCKKPLCVGGCPVDIDIPAFIELIKKKDYEAAIKKIKEKNSLPAICGRVCPQEDQCEKVCIVGKKGVPVSIGALERFAADWELATCQKSEIRDQKKLLVKVAVVGSGPAGLTCAGDLAKMGYDVILFESLHISGGVLMYGIPEFRLPKKIVQAEIEYIKNLGVQIKTNMVIGKSMTVDELFKEGFSAIFVATGAGLPQFPGIPGENLNRIYSANEFLTRVNLMKAYKFPQYDTPINIGSDVVAIGAGNVAFDSARVALRLGARSVTIVYRRTENEMPARIEEIENAKEEGIKFKLLTAPIRFIPDEKGFVKEIECIQMELGEPDESRRRRPIPKKGSEFVIKADTVIVAIGQSPNPLIPHAMPLLKLGKQGNIMVDTETMMTSIPGIFAGGDIVTGADTVISAMGAGKKAAVAIDKYLINK